MADFKDLNVDWNDWAEGFCTTADSIAKFDSILYRSEVFDMGRFLRCSLEVYQPLEEIYVLQYGYYDNDERFKYKYFGFTDEMKCRRKIQFLENKMRNFAFRERGAEGPST